MNPSPEPLSGGVPTEVIVVASWYPGIEDVASGRFVADQVVALDSTKRVVPLVVSFDRLALVGGATARGRQVEPVYRTVAEAVRSEQPIFLPTAFGVDRPIRIARLAIADGTTPAIGTTSQEAHRRAALVALADRIDADGSPSPALVHAHTGYPDGAAAAGLAERLGCPLVITEHATFLARTLAEPAQRRSYAMACSRAARIIAVSQVLADQITDALPDVADRVVIVPNAVAVDEFRAPALDERVPDELLFVGYRKEVKGIGTLLEAFALVLAERPTARLRLIGGSPSVELEARWEALAAQLDIADRVSFEGAIGRPEIADAMARASVYVHASRYETFGVVVAEALASGLPVVATDSGGVTEILGAAPERFGALVAVDDRAALAAALLETLGRRASFEPEVLRASVRERFGARFVAERIANLYDEVLAEAARSRPSGDPPTRAARGPATRSSADADRPMPPGPAQMLIVGLDRGSAAERLARLPAALVADLGLITSREPASAVLPPLRWVAEARLPAVPGPPVPGEPVAAGLGAFSHRIRRFLSDPVGAMRSRAGRTALTDDGIAFAARELERVLAGIGGDSADVPEPLDIVPLDGRDVMALQRLPPDPSRRISAGGLGRLGDRWASAVKKPGPTRNGE